MNTCAQMRCSTPAHRSQQDIGNDYHGASGIASGAFVHPDARMESGVTIDPGAVIGDEQLGWLASDLSDRPRNAPIVVLTHRPLFDLYPQWDWATRDASRAIALLEPFEHVTVFYGHIHQEHHQMTGRIALHAARSLIFPLPPPGSQPKRTPIAWDAAAPYRGLGWRDIEADAARAYYELQERPVQGA